MESTLRAPDAGDAGEDCFDESCWPQLWDDPAASELGDPVIDPPLASLPTALDAGMGSDALLVADAATPTQDAAIPVDAGCAGQPEPPCPPAPPGYEPQNPGIPSGAQCRGACGPNCPATCVAGTPTTTCVEWQSADCGWHAKTCTYATLSCGSNTGCRTHDACYDTCARGLKGAACRRLCDVGCIRMYGVTTCRAWMKGNPPYDKWTDYAGAPTSQTYDTTCY